MNPSIIRIWTIINNQAESNGFSFILWNFNTMFDDLKILDERSLEQERGTTCYAVAAVSTIYPDFISIFPAASPQVKSISSQNEDEFKFATIHQIARSG